MRGAQTSQGDSARRSAFEQDVRALQELDLKSLADGLLSLVVGEIDTYQRLSTVEDVVQRPFPSSIPPTFAADLARNTTTYETEIEEAFDTDPVMEMLYASPTSTEKTYAIRARRSALVLGLIAFQQAEQNEASV